MLWVALHFPQLRQQALARGHAPPEPEREALAAIAAWACGFTPRVSLEPPQALLLEAGGSLRYFGGQHSFLDKLRAGVAELGFEAGLACAPTARAALWRARGEGKELEQLPVATMEPGAESLQLLASLGVRSVGELLGLPREGIGLRFGEALLVALDEARGLTPEARKFFAPPPRFRARLQLPSPVSEAGRTLFAAQRLLKEMEGFLAGRQAGVRGFSLGLLHEDIADTVLHIGLAAPGRDAAHFGKLLLERLQRLPLAAPVEAIRLEAGALETLAMDSGNFFRDPRQGGEAWLRLVERLQARLGHEAVHGLRPHADHRPERAFREVVLEVRNEGKKEEQEKDAGPRPLWLLDAPRPLLEGKFTLLAGPERIESGWWDGAEARRDYFIARLGESLAWVYREREGRWFLHGLFA
jgi:protein ImuB